MFNSVFSFNGRIRRREYGYTIILYAFIIAITDGFTKNERTSNFMVVVYIALIWLVMAQGTKRCHDINNSGWCQIIPLYVLWMIFKDGDAYSNSYGENPKQNNVIPAATKSAIINTIVTPNTSINNTLPITNLISSLQQHGSSNTVANKLSNQQTVLEVANTNYSLTQEILKKLRNLDQTTGLTYTILGTKATITINHNGSSQMLLDAFYTTIENIEVLEVHTGAISIKIK